MKMELRSKAIDKVYKRRDRIEMPDYQREEVWTDDQKRQLIDTILRGWHLPKFYFRKLDEGAFECVDGQQRLTAIWEFYDGKMRLTPASAKQFGGATYEELSDQVSDAFDDYEIDIEELDDTSDEELRELFVRLQLGTPLTTAEKLNAQGGGARDFAMWMSDQPFFDKKLGVKDTRYAHFDIATKWLFAEARGIQPQIRYAQLEDFIRTNKTFSPSNEVAKNIKEALKYLDAALPDHSKLLKNRASALSVGMLAACVTRARISLSTAASFGKFLASFFNKLTLEVEKGAASTDTEMLKYQEAISYGSSAGDSITTRFRILSQQLATFDPAFAQLLTVGANSGNEVQTQLATLADQIANEIYEVNERAAGDVGDDVFKMTNKTSKAVAAFGQPVTTSEQFSKFVDGLYFLAYEGTGECKRLPSPPPNFAMDIKFLRNFLRHDLDHGDAKESAQKRRRGGTIFRRYSGKQSLGECSPAEFTAAQMALLADLKSLLSTL